MIKMIVAIDKNGIIAKNNQIPWHISSDLQFFKYMTIGHTLVCGRKTFDSLGSKPLGNRDMFVLSKKLQRAKGVKVFHSIVDCITYMRKFRDNPNKIFWIIGGGEIYNSFINIVEEIIVTHVETEIDGVDLIYFPKERLKEFVVRNTVYVQEEIPYIVRDYVLPNAEINTMTDKINKFFS